MNRQWRVPCRPACPRGGPCDRDWPLREGHRPGRTRIHRRCRCAPRTPAVVLRWPRPRFGLLSRSPWRPGSNRLERTRRRIPTSRRGRRWRRGPSTSGRPDWPGHGRQGRGVRGCADPRHGGGCARCAAQWGRGAARRLGLQKRRHFGARAAHEVHRLGAGRARGRTQHVGDVVPQQVAQLRQPGSARAPGPDVAALVRATQPQRRGGQLAAYIRAPLPIARNRRLVGQPSSNSPSLTRHQGRPQPQRPSRRSPETHPSHGRDPHRHVGT